MANTEDRKAPTARRLTGDVKRGRQVTMTIDDRLVEAYEGESIAAALLAEGQRGLRRTPHAGALRGLFCAMGVCFDCVLTIDGDRRVRSCMTMVRNGLRVKTD